jgi:hypothetical protein
MGETARNAQHHNPTTHRLGFDALASLMTQRILGAEGSLGSDISNPTTGNK